MKFGKRKIQVVPHLDKDMNFSQTFVQDNREINMINKLRRDYDAQYTNDKSMKLKCSIPEVDFIKYSYRFFINGRIDEKELDKWLDSEEGEHCKTVKGPARFA